MFGYVNINRPEMKIREFEYYRSTYCGLCRSLGKCTGQCSRMTLNYDFAFLALVRIAVCGSVPEFGRKRCIAHPFRKQGYMLPCPELDYCACAGAILNYHKCLDDIHDEAGMKKLGAALLRPAASTMRRKADKYLNAKKEYSELDERVREYLLKLAKTEREEGGSVDAPAAVFGELLGTIASAGLDGAQKKIAAEFGFHIGKWLYIIDALDDYPNDLKKGRYNPFFAQYGKEGFSEDTTASLRTALTNELVGVSAAFDLIDTEVTDIKAIIGNIIYEGMPQRANRVLSCGKIRRETND